MLQKKKNGGPQCPPHYPRGPRAHWRPHPTSPGNPHVHQRHAEAGVVVRESTTTRPRDQVSAKAITLPASRQAAICDLALEPGRTARCVQICNICQDLPPRPAAASQATMYVCVTHTGTTPCRSLPGVCGLPSTRTGPKDPHHTPTRGRQKAAFGVSPQQSRRTRLAFARAAGRGCRIPEQEQDARPPSTPGKTSAPLLCLRHAMGLVMGNSPLGYTIMARSSSFPCCRRKACPGMAVGA